MNVYSVYMYVYVYTVFASKHVTRPCHQVYKKIRAPDQLTMKNSRQHELYSIHANVNTDVGGAQNVCYRPGLGLGWRPATDHAVLHRYTTLACPTCTGPWSRPRRRPRCESPLLLELQSRHALLALLLELVQWAIGTSQ